MLITIKITKPTYSHYVSSLAPKHPNFIFRSTLSRDNQKDQRRGAKKMFPFLAPIRQPSFRFRMELTPERRIEITFMADTPHVSRRASEQIGQERTEEMERTDSQVIQNPY